MRLAAAIVLCMLPAYAQVIEGDVVDASSGQAIAGARVRIQSGQDDPLCATADEKGHFRFEGLQDRRYDIGARYPGFATISQPIFRTTRCFDWRCSTTASLRGR